MKIKLYQVDAFSDRVFAGNPAAVVPLESWLDDALLQAIAAENSLSETAFIVPQGEGHAIRWMTPTHEVDLCGHATLAAGYVLFNEGGISGDRVVFSSASGALAVERRGDLLTLDFPSRPATPIDAPQGLAKALGCEIETAFAAGELVLVPLDDQAHVEAVKPSFSALAECAPSAVVVTAPGADVDFVSRFFAPAMGIPEDPVTGSAHCTLAPYWSERLGKRTLRARQCSTRGGELVCEVRGERVHISGRAALYLTGEIQLP